MLLPDRIGSGGTGNRRGRHPPVTVQQFPGNPNHPTTCATRSCSIAAWLAATGGEETRHPTVLIANPAWGGGGARVWPCQTRARPQDADLTVDDLESAVDCREERGQVGAGVPAGGGAGSGPASSSLSYMGVSLSVVALLALADDEPVLVQHGDGCGDG
jgi:hypothetical protein